MFDEIKCGDEVIFSMKLYRAVTNTGKDMTIKNSDLNLLIDSILILLKNDFSSVHINGEELNISVIRSRHNEVYLLAPIIYQSKDTIRRFSISLNQYIKKQYTLENFTVSYNLIPFVELTEDDKAVLKRYKNVKYGYIATIEELVRLNILYIDGRNKIDVVSISNEEVLIKYRLYHFGIDSKFFQFHCMVQPKVDVATGKYIGGEILSRLKGNKGKLISPSVFIPSMNSLGLIKEMDFKMLQFTLDELSRYKEVYRGKKLSVNISLSNFCDSTIGKEINKLLNQYDQEVLKMLEIEITEYDAFTSDLMFILTNVTTELRLKGIKISIDDMGSEGGYSAISLLSKMNVDTVKFDKSLSDLITTRQGAANIEALKTYADKMHAEVILEGIETLDQLMAAKELGINKIQGYYFSPPIELNIFRTQINKTICLNDMKSICITPEKFEVSIGYNNNNKSDHNTICNNSTNKNKYNESNGVMEYKPQQYNIL